MINFSLPGSGLPLFVSSWGSGVGVFGPFYRTDGINEKWRHPLDFLRENKGKHNENFCSQRKTVAQFQFSPLDLYATKQSDGRYSYRSRVVGRTGITTGTTSRDSLAIYPRWRVSRKDLIRYKRVPVSPTECHEFVAHYRNNGALHKVDQRIYTTEKPDGKKEKVRVSYLSYYNFLAKDVKSPTGDPEYDFHRYSGDEGKTGSNTYSSDNYVNEWIDIKTDVTSLDLSTKARINSVLSKKFDTPDFDVPSFGELAGVASSKMDANQVNMFAFLRDLKDPKSMLLKLRNLKKLSELASNHLAIQYGWLPTIEDLKLILKAFKPNKQFDIFGYRTLHEGSRAFSAQEGFNVEYTRRLKLAIAHNDRSMNSLSEKLHNIGAFPTFENIWDLVPYSFVVDWFIDIGGFLESVDSKSRVARLAVVYCTMSDKARYEFAQSLLEGTGCVGYAHVTVYTRSSQDRTPLPPISIGGGSGVASHWLEASALIIQRR